MWSIYYGVDLLLNSWKKLYVAICRQVVLDEETHTHVQFNFWSGLIDSQVCWGHTYIREGGCWIDRCRCQIESLAALIRGIKTSYISTQSFLLPGLLAPRLSPRNLAASWNPRPSSISMQPFFRASSILSSLCFLHELQPPLFTSESCSHMASTQSRQDGIPSCQRDRRRMSKLMLFTAAFFTIHPKVLWWLLTYSSDSFH